MSVTLAIGRSSRFAPASKATCSDFGQILHRDDVAAQAHAPQDHHLRLDRFAQETGAQGHKGGEGHGRGRPRVVQFDDVQMVVMVTGFDRGADVRGVGLEVVEADFDRLPGGRVAAQARCRNAPLPAVTCVSRRYSPRCPLLPWATVCITPGFKGPCGDQRTAALFGHADELLLQRLLIDGRRSGHRRTPCRRSS